MSFEVLARGRKEAHEVVKEFEAMNASQRALQNSSLSVGGPQVATSPAGSNADKKKKKKKKNGESQVDSALPLDAKEKKKKKKVCFLMRDHGSCKHGDRCEYSHEKGLVEAERKKKEADKAKGGDSSAAASSSGKGKGKGKNKDNSVEFPVAALERWAVPEVVNGLAEHCGSEAVKLVKGGRPQCGGPVRRFRARRALAAGRLSPLQRCGL